MTVRPKVIYLADRSPNLSPEAFRPRWLEHGRLAMSLPIWASMWKYAQCDPIVAGNYSPACDAIGLVWYKSWQALDLLAQQPSLREPILADELETFSGPVRHRAMLTEEIVILEGPETDFKLFLFELEASTAAVAHTNAGARRVVRSNTVSNAYTSATMLPYKSVLEIYYSDAQATNAAALSLDSTSSAGNLVIGARERRLYGPVD